MAAVLVSAPGTAVAHPLSTTAILLDLGTDRVTGQVQLPIDRLAIARDEPLTPATVTAPEALEQLRRYVDDHLTVTDPGRPVQGRWEQSVTGGRVESIDDVDHLVYDLTLSPPDGVVRDFELHYSAIVERLVSHRIFVASRQMGAETYTAVGIIDWESTTLPVPASGTGASHGFIPAVHLGLVHIAEGADHLLFLVMLLLAAPLVARQGRWVRAESLPRQCVRVVHVITAFAVGHSITLALAALGYISISTRLVESAIALSILVSAIHAVKPLVPGGEVWIAAVFGLVHGLAFAALLDQLELGRGSLFTELLGFNLGIELAQLLVVALIMPSLLLLSRTPLYPALRTALACFGLVLACGWLAERTSMVTANPLEGLSTTLVAHPFAIAAIAAAVAGVAVLAWAVPGLRDPRRLSDHAGRS